MMNPQTQQMDQVLLTSQKQVETNPTNLKVGVVGAGQLGAVEISYLAKQHPKLCTRLALLMAVETDAVVLNGIAETAITKIRIGPKGRGTGGNPKLAEEYIRVANKDIQEKLQDLELLFIIVGVGGGTGSGAGLGIAQIAKNMGIPTICMALRPLSIEGRQDVAEDYIKQIFSAVHGVSIDELDRLYDIVEQTPDITFSRARALVYEVIAKRINSVISLLLNGNKDSNADIMDILAVLMNNVDARSAWSNEETYNDIKNPYLFIVGMSENDVKTKGSSDDNKTLDNMTTLLHSAFSNTFASSDDLVGAKNIIVNISCNENDLLASNITRGLHKEIIKLTGVEKGKPVKLKISEISIDTGSDSNISIIIIAKVSTNSNLQTIKNRPKIDDGSDNTTPSDSKVTSLPVKNGSVTLITANGLATHGEAEYNADNMGGSNEQKSEPLPPMTEQLDLDALNYCKDVVPESAQMPQRKTIFSSFKNVVF